MSNVSFPQDIDLFIAQQIAEGKYRSEEELMINAVRILREVEARKQQFAEELRFGFEQLERGEYHEYDETELRNRFEELKNRARCRIESRSKDA
jgi:putative addiction module CopG family antidote